MDLSSYTLSDLRKLEKKVQAEITRRASHTSKMLLKRMEKLASDEGVSLEDVLQAAGQSRPAPAATAPGPEPRPRARRATTTTAAAGTPKKDRLPPIYFKPGDPSVGWSGMGRKPNWVLAWTEAGKDLELLRTPQPAEA